MLIVCTDDWHLRPDKPACRKESTAEWIETQLRKVNFIMKYAFEKEAIIIFAGDFSHKASDWPSWFNNEIISIFQKYPVPFYGIPGQHDLPYHDHDRINQSNFNIFNKIGFITYPFEGGYSWGSQVPYEEKANIIAIHAMIIKTEKDEIFPGQLSKSEATTAQRILMQFPDTELFVTGDNHIPFHFKYDGRYLLNSGSITRQRSSENHKPGFYTYNTDNKEVKWITIPHRKDVILKEEESLYNLLNKTSQNPEILSLLTEEIKNRNSISYWDLLMDYVKRKKIRKEVQEILMRAGGHENG